MSFSLGPEFQRALLRLCLDNEAFAVLVAKHLKPSFFETPALSWIFSMVQWYLTTYTRPPTPFIVIDACRRLDPALAAQYLPTVESVCTAAVVEERYIGDKLTEFIKRNLVVDGVEKLRLLYNQGDVDATVRFFQERADEIHGVNLGAVDRSFFFEDIEARTMRRAREAAQGHLYTFSTGIPDLDAVLNGGLSKGELGVWVAYPKMGKALDNDEPVLVPGGWKRMGDMQEGDIVIGGSSGERQLVTGVFPQGAKPCSRVHFSDGTSVVASDDHLWKIQTRKTRLRRETWVVCKTSELFEHGDSPRVPTVAVKDGTPTSQLPLDPYLLGLLIRDGAMTESTVRFCKPERDLRDEVSRRLPAGDITKARGQDDGRNPYIAILNRTGVSGGKRSLAAQELDRLGLLFCHSRDKFVPDLYKFGDAEVRLEVLRGLFDTDGHVPQNGCGVEFSTSSDRLKDDVLFIVRSLGGIAYFSEKCVNDVRYWRGVASLPAGVTPIRSKKNTAKWEPRAKAVHRNIVLVEPVGERDCTCITVDDPEHLFVTRDHIVTHNSHMLQWLAYYAVRALRIPVLYVVLEGGREQAEDRFEAAFTYSTAMDLKQGNVDAHRMRSIRDEYRELKDLLVIRGYTKDVAWNASVTDVYAEIVDLRQRRGFRPRLIVVDYGDLLHPREKQESETRSQAAAFRDMKALCDRDEGYALWTASQAQRPLKGAVDNPDHLVRSSQIADCYEKVRCADFIGSLNRTTEEARLEKMRIYAELYRSAPAGRLIEVRTDFAHHRAVTMVLRATHVEEPKQTEVEW